MADDTIVAPATAPGEAAVAVVRLSGPAAVSLAAAHFRGKRTPEAVPSHRILHGQFCDSSGTPIDTVLLSVFRAPHSYTGEDVVEVASHGGSVVPAAIVAALVRSGARPARPGEFTERAFRNGKVDLSQAEAVAGLIRARSDAAARAARESVGGAVTRRVGRLDAELVDLLAEVEARIDVPNDVGDPLDGAALASRCAAAREQVSGWVDQIPASRRRDQGLSVVLAGPPNVGKSSLLNALVRYDRAIVGAMPGTTRDTVEGTMLLDGTELLLTDTAGIRASEDAVEREGMERTVHALERSDLLVLVLDRSEPEGGAAGGIRALGAALPNGGARPVVVAWNKADLPRRERTARSAVGAALGHHRVLAEVETVAIEPAGAESLRDALRAALPDLVGGRPGDEMPATSARQEALLREVAASLDRAELALLADEPYDLIAADLTEARRALGEVVGRGVDQAVVAAIFARFCVGK